jgi:hypothetical protein
VTDFSTFVCVHRYGLLALLAMLLTACGSIPGPGLVDEYADYGPFPKDYQSIATAYLQSQPGILPLDMSTAKFLNTPDKFTYSQIGRSDKYGYRVCAMVTTVDGRETSSNFLLINNDKVITHLHDTGLVRLSDRFCNVEMLMLGSTQTTMSAEVTPVVVAAVPAAVVNDQSFEYIVCRAGDKEIFFAFDAEKNQLSEQRDGRVVTTFVIEQLTDTFIIATSTRVGNTRVSINRVSGTLHYQNAGIESEGRCKLASQQQF